MKRSIIIYLFFFVLSIPLYAECKLDSLERESKKLDGNDRIDVLNKLAYEYRAYFPSKSVSYAKKALKLSEDSGYKEGEAFALINLSAGYHHGGNQEKVLPLLYEGLQKNIKIRNFKAISIAYRYLGNISAYYGDIDSSNHYYKLALDAAKKVDYLEGMDVAYNNIAVYLNTEGKKDQALSYFQKALEIRIKLKDWPRVVDSYHFIAKLYKNYGELEKSVEYFLKAFNTAKNIGTPAGTAESLKTLGWIYHSWGNREKAEENLLRSLEIYKEIGPDFQLVNTLMSVGNFYTYMNDHETAYKYNKEAAELARKIGHKQNYGNALASLSYNQFMIGDVFESLEIFRKALAIYKEVGENMELIALYRDAAVPFIKMGDFQTAKDFLDEAYRICTEVGNKIEMRTIHNSYGKYYKELGDFEKALEHYYRSLDINDSLNLTPQYDLYKDISDIYSKMGKYELSNQYLKRFTTVKDSIFNEERMQKLANMQLQFEMDKKENEILIKDLQLKEQRSIMIAAGIIAFIILISAIFAFRAYRTKRKINILLEEKNKELEQANKKLSKSETELMNLNNVKDNYLSIITSDLEKAADYVQSLLPAPMQTDYIETNWSYIPSSQIGGDSFGYHWIDEKHFAIYLLDVSGHGVGSALHSVSVLNVIKSQTLPQTDFKVPSEVLNSLNKAFQMKQHNKMFFTIWYGVYNIDTKELHYATAGHPPGLLLPENNDPIQLSGKNYVIGGVRQFDYNSEILKIDRPSQLYIYSDGVYEIRKEDGDIWTLDEFNDFIIKTTSKNGKELDTIYTSVLKMNNSGKLSDDFSILKIRFKQ